MNKIKIIKDLGMIFLREDSNQKRHALILECPLCTTHFRAGQYDYNIGKVTKCKSCASKIGATVHGLSRHRIFKIHSDMIQRCCV